MSLLKAWVFNTVIFKIKFSNVYFERERERERRSRERETQNPKQIPGSELSCQHRA